VTVKPKVPTGTVDVVVTVSVEEPPDVTDGGLKLDVAPDGRPLTPKLIACAEPVKEVLTAKVTGLPRVTPCEAGETLMPKSVGALKFADTVIGPFIATFWGVSVPVRLPEKPTKLSPLAGVAAIGTIVPASYQPLGGKIVPNWVAFVVRKYVTVQVVDAVLSSDGAGSALRCDRMAVTR